MLRPPLLCHLLGAALAQTAAESGDVLPAADSPSTSNRTLVHVAGGLLIITGVLLLLSGNQSIANRFAAWRRRATRVSSFEELDSPRDFESRPTFPDDVEMRQQEEAEELPIAPPMSAELWAKQRNLLASTLPGSGGRCSGSAVGALQSRVPAHGARRSAGSTVSAPPAKTAANSRCCAARLPLQSPSEGILPAPPLDNGTRTDGKDDDAEDDSDDDSDDSDDGSDDAHQDGEDYEGSLVSISSSALPADLLAGMLPCSVAFLLDMASHAVS